MHLKKINMKKMLLSISLAILHTFCFGQTTAPDFTAVDCDGYSHNLYTELNSGKIVVIIWVMPCWGCISGAQAADSAVQDLASLNPNGILLWIVDDGPPSDCAYVESWVTSIGLKKQTVFGNYNNEINQDSYGGFGMPHVTVITPDKTIHYNQFNTTGSDIYGAIQYAINVATDVREMATVTGISIYPNPTSEFVNIINDVPVDKVILTTDIGQVVQEFQCGGIRNPRIAIGDVPPGSYLLRVIDTRGNEGCRKINKVNQ
jgi:hypothetical protein